MVRELKTIPPYECNDDISGVYILSDYTCRSLDVMDVSAPPFGVYEAIVLYDVSLNDILVFYKRYIGSA